MFKLIYSTLFLIVSTHILTGQQNFSDDPLNAQFITTDYDNFWKIFDNMKISSSNPFDEYLENASDGLRPFVDYFNVDSLYKTVVRRKQDYLKSRTTIDGISSEKKKIQALNAAMKYWYPEARFPPIFFAVGMFTTGGTVSENGLLIGSEMLESIDALSPLVAHELIHFQQNITGENNLLKQVIIEGSADFIGELISGENVNLISFNYGEHHKNRLSKEFVSIMYLDDYVDWLYGTSGKDDRPNDLGYWMGYKIAEAYFYKQKVKKLAVREILNIKNPKEFMKESGFLSEYLD